MGAVTRPAQPAGARHRPDLVDDGPTRRPRPPRRPGVRRRPAPRVGRRRRRLPGRPATSARRPRRRCSPRIAVDRRRDADGAEHRLAAAADPSSPATPSSWRRAARPASPKGVVLTHDAVAASARATSARLGVDRRRPLAGLPAALPRRRAGVVTRALSTGTRAHRAPRLRPARPCSRRRRTLGQLVRHGAAAHRPDRFRAIVLGGAAPPDDLPANVVTTYGMTETGSGVVYDGRPLDGVEVRIGRRRRDPRARPDAAARLPRADADSIPRPDGWLATGDLGRWLADGRLARRRSPRRPDHHRRRERVAGARRAGDPAPTPGWRTWRWPARRRRMGPRRDGVRRPVADPRRRRSTTCAAPYGGVARLLRATSGCSWSSRSRPRRSASRSDQRCDQSPRPS